MHYKVQNLRLFTILVGIVLGLSLFWFGSYRLAIHSLGNNLWSIQYLWKHKGHSFSMLLPTSTTPSPTHHRARLWDIRELIAAKQYLQAETLLKPLLTSGGSDVLRLFSELQIAQNDLPGAIQTLTTMQAIDDLLTIGEQAQAHGQSSIALLAFQSAYSINPEPVVLPLAALYWREEGQTVVAEELLRQYLTIFPHSRYNTRWLRELGSLYRATGEWDNAINVFGLLVEIAPDSTVDWIQLGWVMYERGDGTEIAIERFQKAIAIAPSNAGAYYAIASLLVREQRHQDALYWYAEAVERSSSQPTWYLQWALALQRTGEMAEALKVIRTVERRFPNFAAGHYEAAALYLSARDLDKAITAVEEAIGLIEGENIPLNEQFDYYLLAGQIYEQAGAFTSAIKAYRKALAIDSRNQSALDGLERLH